MGVEIERKFLTRNGEWRALDTGIRYTQGYLSREHGRTVRIRIAGDKAFLTVKGASVGCSRPEFEYPVPADDARGMLELCDGPLIDKTRRRIPHAGHLWEVDEFHGMNEGLVIAEVELSSPDESVDIPPWIGEEVTGDRRYDNSSLSVRPYSSWS